MGITGSFVIRGPGSAGLLNIGANRRTGRTGLSFDDTSSRQNLGTMADGRSGLLATEKTLESVRGKSSWQPFSQNSLFTFKTLQVAKTQPPASRQ